MKFSLRPVARLVRAGTTALTLALAPLPAADWPMLGGRPDRNNVSSETGLPTTDTVRFGPAVLADAIAAFHQARPR